ncbi:MAG: hypothetical protein IKA00_03890 [Prevotella sp.]|nr:hypothetical protein [Prevotella sp.]MBR3858516.1 hypothetical protein [Bacteroidaceae bacterium]
MTVIRKQDIARRMRQVLQSGREARRELTLHAKYPDDASCLDASGAIRLTIRDFMPELVGNDVLPPGLELDYGVDSTEVWPVSINDVEIEEEDEVGELTDQSLGFAQIRGAEPVRSGITVEVSNQAIDSAAFDLLGYIQKRFTLAQRRYIAQHLYSNARWDGNNGPFSGAHASQWAIPHGSLYDSIMAQMTLLEMEGYDTREAVIIMDHTMEVRLKNTPIREEEGRMVIQDGLCCGYPYIANKYYNTELDESGHLVRKAMDAVSIGIFKWFKIAQHDQARLIVDGVSKEVSERNVTAITLTTAWSFTNLSEKVNGGTGVQAFRTLMMRKGYLADVNSMVFRTADGKLLRVGLKDMVMTLVDKDGNVIQSSDGKSFLVNFIAENNG